MKTLMYSLLTVALAGFAQANGLPGGDYHFKVTSPTSRIWDLSALDGIRSVEMEFEDVRHNSEVEIRFPVAVDFSPVGKMTGRGNATVWWGFRENAGNWNVTEFSGAYTVSGTIASSKGVAKGTFTSSVVGQGTMHEAMRTLKAKQTRSFSINNASGIASGTDKISASASGKGSISVSQNFGPEDIRMSGPGNADWDLFLEDLVTAANGKTITGEATVVLSSASELHFVVKGTYDAKKQTAKLVLTGTTESKGNSLQVGLVNNEIKTLKGKLLGQTVDVK
jgi:hypothetical protein